MSEDGDIDIDVESAEDVPDIGVEATATTIDDGMDYSDPSAPVDKRAHHNALERRRRDHIKDSFYGLRDCIPAMQGEKVSRAHILNKATEYIRNMQRNGLLREGEIGSLQKKNEVLEEQVRALEAAKALGSNENAEEIIQAVAEKVQTRQKVQDAKQQQQAKGGEQTPVVKSEGGINAKSASAVVVGSGGASKPAGDQPQLPGNKQPSAGNATKVNDGSAHLSSNAINLLASNLKNTQNLLSVLQKSNANLPANIKSLAARVLASPLGRQAVGVDGSLPRRIVTATTVPKGSAFSSTPLPPNAQKQTTPTSTTTQSKVTSCTNTPPLSTSGGNAAAVAGNSDQISAATASSSGDPPSSGDVQTSPPQPNDIAPLTLSQVVDTSLQHNSVAMTTTAAMTSSGATETNTNTLSTSSSTALLSSNSVASLSSQFLAAHTLLQQQGSEINGGGLGGSLSVPPGGAEVVPTISPELLAQVSSFLNLPAVSTATGTSVGEGEGVGSSLSITCDVGGAEGVVSDTVAVQIDSDSTISQPNPTQETNNDSLKDTAHPPTEMEHDEPLSKKPRLEL